MTHVSACVCMSLGIALAVSSHCAAAPVEKRPGDGIVFADADTTARKLGLEWKDLDQHIADAVARKEKPLTKADGDALALHLRAARTAVLTGDLKLAREESAKAQAIDAKFPEAEFLHGVILFEAGHPQAETAWKSWAERHPDDFFATNYLALIFADSPDIETRTEGFKLAKRNLGAHPASLTAQLTRLFTGSKIELTADEDKLQVEEIRKLLHRLDLPVQEKQAGDLVAIDQIDCVLTLDEAFCLSRLCLNLQSTRTNTSDDELRTARTLLIRIVETPGPVRQFQAVMNILKIGSGRYEPPKLRSARRTY